MKTYWNEPRIRYRLSIWSIRITLLVFMLSCNFLSLNTPTPEITSLTTPNPDNSPYDILRITPRPDHQLCWNPELEGYGGSSWEEAKANIPVDSGVGGGMGEGDLSDALLKGWSTYEVKPEIPLTGKFHLLYPKTPLNTLPIELRYLLILDEMQIPGAFDENPGFYHDVPMQPGDEITLTLNIPPLAQGVHDLIVLSLNGVQHEPDPYGSIKLAGFRFTLISGANPEISPRSFEPLLKQGSLAKNDPLLSLELSLSGEYPFSVWNWPETHLPVSIKESLPYYIFTAYSVVEGSTAPNPPIPEAVPFALLTFLDYQQIDFALATPVFYGSVSKDTAYTALRASVGPFQEAGQHDLLILRIKYPGLPMCLLQGPSDGYIFDHYLEARRVGIEVIQEP